MIRSRNQGLIAIHWEVAAITLASVFLTLLRATGKPLSQVPIICPDIPICVLGIFAAMGRNRCSMQVELERFLFLQGTKAQTLLFTLQQMVRLAFVTSREQHKAIGIGISGCLPNKPDNRASCLRWLGQASDLDVGDAPANHPG